MIGRIFTGMLRTLTVSIVATLAIVATLSIGDKPALAYTNNPFPPQRDVVQAGQIVPLLVARCNRSSQTIVYETTRGIENLESRMPQILPTAPTILDPGCMTATSYANRIPIDTTPGMYRVFGTAIVPGVFRDHTIPWASTPFTVIAPQ